MAIFNELINLHKHLKYLHLGFFFVLPTLTSIYSSGELLQSEMKWKSLVETGRVTNYLTCLMPERFSNIRMDFCNS